MDTERPLNEESEDTAAFPFDQEILDAFVRETREHLENIGQYFLNPEKQMPDQTYSESILQKIRAVKLSSEFMQFPKIAEIASVTESLFQKTPSGETLPESPHLNAFSQVRDLLNHMLENIRKSENTDIQPLRDCIGKLPDRTELVQNTKERTSAGSVKEAQTGRQVHTQNMEKKGNRDKIREEDEVSNEEFDTDREILDMFIVEVRDHLQNIEKDFLILETQAYAPDQEIIDRVFRAIHSIKGSSGMIRLKKISKLAHVMETMLQKMRSGTILPEFRYMDALLAGCDSLREMINNVETGEKETDTREIYERLSGLMKETMSIPRERKTEEIKTELPGEEAKKPERPVKTFDQETLDIFIAEAKDHIRNAEKNFLILENQASGPNNRIVDKIFRAIHSVKGSAAVLEFEKISKLAHVMESLLQKMRSREISNPSSDHIEALLAGCDLLNEMTDNISETSPDERNGDISIQDVHHRLSELLDDIPNSESGSESNLPKKETRNIVGTRREHSDTVRIKVNLLNLLMTLAGELVLVRNQQLLMLNDLDPASRNMSQRMNMVTTQLQETIMRTRMQPVGNLFARLPRIVRDVSRKLGKQIQIVTSGEDVELDKTILESLSDPLTHIVRNSCDHGIELPEERYGAGKAETGIIEVRAFHEGGQINIVIRDDGKGADPQSIREKAEENGLRSMAELRHMNDKEMLSLIMMPGFSTSGKTTEISGRGVGMDVVKSAVEGQGGSVEMTSESGEGMTVHLRLPLTLAIIPSLIVNMGKARYAIPKVSVDELVCLYDRDIYKCVEYAGDQEVFRLRDTLIPMVRMNEVLDRPERFSEAVRSEITEKYSRIANAELKKSGRIRKTLLFAVVKVGNRRFGLIVDKIVGTEEIVVNSVHTILKSLSIYSGTTIMGDGTVSLILDIHGIADHTGVEFISDIKNSHRAILRSDDENTQRVLIFKNGGKERFAVPLSLVRRVEEISADRIERVGSKSYITVGGMPTLILHLDKLLDVSPPCVEKNRMYLLLPRHVHRPFGILMTQLVDVVTVPLMLDENSHVEDGILGTAVVQDRMTLFPDIWRLLEKADPRRNIPDEKSDLPVPDRNRILLVEDTVFFRRLVRGYLESGGYEVKTAENGSDALKRMAETDFNLIVSDIEMPKMDGWTFLRQVRSSEKHRDIPAIALTTLDSPEDRARGKRVGFNAYEKKIDREHLLASVTRLLKGYVYE